MSPVPYWQSPDGTITVYHARCEDVLAAGLVPARDVALVHADPVYGSGDSDTRRHGDGTEGQRSKGARRGLAGGGRRRFFAPLTADDRAFDPAPLLALDRPLVVWGGHLCEPPLPSSRSWLWWDKREDVTPDDNGDGEMAWTNLGGPLRQFSHLWRGALRRTEKVEAHLHPTQKPIALCSWVYQRAKLKPGALVFVPYLGSGPDLPAARAAGLRIVACEVEESYCATAIARLGAVTPERAAQPAGPLFATRQP